MTEEQNTTRTDTDLSKEIDKTMEYLQKRATHYRRLSNGGNMLRIILSSSIPVMISISSHYPNLLIFVSMTGALIGILQTAGSFFGVDNKSNALQQTILSMQKERLLFESQNAPYDAPTRKENEQRFLKAMADEIDDRIDVQNN